MTVDWTKVDQKPIPKIIDQGSSSHGPAPLGPVTETSKAEENKSLPRALVLGPGGYRSIGHISFLQEIKLKGIKPQVIVGHGLSSVIAAYYAFGFAPDYIEWKFFKLINSLNDLDIFSKPWLKIVKASLLKDFDKKRIEEGSLTLIVPVKNRKTGKVIYLKRGELVSALMANLDHKGMLSKKYEPAFTESFFNRSALEGIGIKQIIAVDLISMGITWVKGSGYLNGIYEKAATVSLKSKGKADIMLSYELEKFAIDNKKSVADLVYRSKELARENVKLILEAKENNKETI